jgi:hypothetical protein
MIFLNTGLKGFISLYLSILFYLVFNSTKHDFGLLGICSMSRQPNISKGTRVVVKGYNARFGRLVESHTTQANTWLVLMDGSRNPTVFAASSLVIAEGGVGCSPCTRVARAVTNGGPAPLR